MPRVGVFSRAPRKGSVVAYDSARGLGSIEELPAKGARGRLYGFHCTSIADGSRDIEVGTAVIFVLFPGLGGIVEAGSVIGLPRGGPG